MAQNSCLWSLYAGIQVFYADLKRGLIVKLHRLTQQAGSQVTSCSSNTVHDHEISPPIAADNMPPLMANGTTSHAAVYPQIDGLTSPCLSSQSSIQILPQLEATPTEAVDNGVNRNLQPPGLAEQLSYRLSAAFSNPTIIHRPKLRTRPSVISLNGGLKLVDDLTPLSASMSPMSPIHSPVQGQQLSPKDDTDPSSYNNSGSVSAGDRSTGKTSFDSTVASVRSQGKTGEGTRENLLPAIDEISTEIDDGSVTPHASMKPTIATVETTANAKIFFETYFSRILSEETTPRSFRRKELELRLQTESFSHEQCQQERYAWAIQESAYLRQNRVLKSKTDRISGNSGVDIAGYQVVRVLGKGSFGVVRLVREKEDTLPRSQPRPISISVLRSTFEGQTFTSRDGRKANSQVYAMKVIRKSDMLRNSQEGHLRAERDFLVASENSRWVVPLIASFQDSTNLYLVMDYMVGGDFLGLLFRKDVLKEKKARWYIAEMILCVEEAHRLRWIHRDVKPDNFLISASGHLKISDFGLAFDGHWAHDQTFFTNHRLSLMEKLGIEVDGDSLDRKEGASVAASMAMADIITNDKRRDKIHIIDSPGENENILQWRDRVGKRRLARSVVGTSQYMAPEVIRGELYDGRCDWWSIGIILYEVGNFSVHDGVVDVIYK